MFLQPKQVKYKKTRKGKLSKFEFKTIKTNSFKNYNSFDMYWFIGFSEGDGSFILRTNGNLEFSITQSQVDVQILYYIKKNLGFGSVRQRSKNDNTYAFRVYSKKKYFKINKYFQW